MFLTLKPYLKYFQIRAKMTRLAQVSKNHDQMHLIRTAHKKQQFSKFTTSTTGPQWTHFLRFLDDSGKIRWGEPIHSKDETYHQAKLIVDGIVTDEVVEVVAVFLQ
jgi:hypothetical protein